MNQSLKCKIWQLTISACVALVYLTFGGQARSQTFTQTGVVLLSQKANNTSSTQNLSAAQVFRNAYDNRYTWDSKFPGYTAAVELKYGKGTYKGRVRVNPDMSVEVTGIDQKEPRQIVENSLGMMLTHRRRVPFDKAHKNSNFKYGTANQTGSVEIIQQQGKTEARYQVSDNQLKQVNRSIGNMAVTVDVLNSQETSDGYLPTRYRTTFRNPKSQEVLGVEDSEDNFEKIGGYYVLTRQIIKDFQQDKLINGAEFHYTDLQLLSNP
ncbi:DUF3386 domain-containing protein [Nostoc sp. FACHB-145]|uniref:DUF3386 domain-containing protein n=1 Tax=Nostoc sp. FACHB-145 TaxID=2692836 RepID=UPI0016845AF3|nr:DUF3386 domain-containing protein [Nostoc sp. FACHB-145]MBD2472613.1 DUF3386 domain-containing protein [Nostoc sp. FACHB-145]